MDQEKEMEHVVDRIMKAFEKLRVEMNWDDLKIGTAPGEAEKILKNLLKDPTTRKGALVTLLEACINSFDDSLFLCTVLHTFSHMKYEELYPKGLMIALGMLSHGDDRVVSHAIKTFSNWNCKDTLRYIQNVIPYEEWAQKDLRDVFNYIKENGYDMIKEDDDPKNYEIVYDENELWIKKKPDGTFVGGYRNELYPIEGLTQKDVDESDKYWYVNYPPDYKVITNYKRVAKGEYSKEAFNGVIITNDDGTETFYEDRDGGGFVSEDGKVLYEANIITTFLCGDHDRVFTIGFVGPDAAEKYCHREMPNEFDGVFEMVRKYYPEIDKSTLESLVGLVYETVYDFAYDDGYEEGKEDAENQEESKVYDE